MPPAPSEPADPEIRPGRLKVFVGAATHTNAPGHRNAHRRQDIEELLDADADIDVDIGAGIDVVTAVNVQHLESLSDVVEKITGVPQGETVPDEVVRARRRRRQRTPPAAA